MTINFNTPQREPDLKPRITVIGVGGAGGNAVNNMISSSVEGVEFIVANTDAQSLAQSLSDRRIQLGKTITQGLGAGARPDVGRAAAEEALPELIEALQGSHMVFVAAGMGGGTGTGAAPVIAAAAREQGILTVGVVTKPFQFEGNHRMRLAEGGIQELEKYVDTLIIIPNQNLFRVANEKTTFADAFKMADDVLCTGVRGVTDLMVMPGLINLDFADIRTVMGEMGKAMMGTGEAEGEKRALAASEAAISNPLLEDASMKGAKGVLINITGGFDMTLMEVDEAANRIREEVDPDANIIFGSTFEQNLAGRMRVSVVATGIQAMAAQQPRPTTMLSLDRNMQTGLPGSQPAQRAAPRSAAAPIMAQPTPQAAPQPMPQAAQQAPVQPAPIQYAAEPEPEPAQEQPLIEAEQPPIQPYAPPQPQTMAPPEPIADWRIAPRPVAEAPRAHPMAAPMPHQSAQPQSMQPQPIQAQPVPRAQQPFIPPRPVEAPQAARAPAPRQVDAFAAAEMANAARAQQTAPPPAAYGEQPARGPNLFQRMTGATRRDAAPAAQPGAPQMAAQPAPQPVPQAAPQPMPQPVSHAAPEPTARGPQPEAPRMRPVQPKLGGLDPSERLQSARAEEDMLDIPAFLRRQAN